MNQFIVKCNFTRTLCLRYWMPVEGMNSSVRRYQPWFLLLFVFPLCVLRYPLIYTQYCNKNVPSLQGKFPKTSLSTPNPVWSMTYGGFLSTERYSDLMVSRLDCEFKHWPRALCCILCQDMETVNCKLKHRHYPSG